MTCPRSHRVKGRLGLDPESLDSGLSKLMGEQEPYQLLSTVHPYRVVIARLWHTSGENSPPYAGEVQKSWDILGVSDGKEKILEAKIPSPNLRLGFT